MDDYWSFYESTKRSDCRRSSSLVDASKVVGIVELKHGDWSLLAVYLQKTHEATSTVLEAFRVVIG